VVSSKDTQGALLNVNSQGGGAGHFAHHTFLNRPAGESGWLAMIVAGLSDTIGDHAILLEGNPRIWLDGNLGEPDLQWTSVEDFANGAYYFEQRNIGEEGGVTAKDDTNYEVAAYKVFHKWPIPYANGIRASVPQYSMVGPAIYNWTTFYYKRM
jgi:hypothetical protein